MRKDLSLRLPLPLISNRTLRHAPGSDRSRDRTGALASKGACGRKLLTLALIALTALGQQRVGTAPPSTGTIPTFTGGTNLVVVDVTVRDKAGKLIEGL